MTNAKRLAVAVLVLIVCLGAIALTGRAEDIRDRAGETFFYQAKRAIMAGPARAVPPVRRNCCGWGDAMLTEPVGPGPAGATIVRVVDPLRQPLYKAGDTLIVSPAFDVRGWAEPGAPGVLPIANPFPHDVLFANANGPICYIRAARY